MNEERLRILKMLEERKISAEEADALLETLESTGKLSEEDPFPTQRERPMTTIAIHGKSLQGRTVSICVDGKPVGATPQSQEDECVSIEVTGDLANLTTNASVRITGDIDGNVVAGGDVSCNDIAGDVKAAGDVNCDDVSGDVEAGGDVNCDDIAGDVEAGGDINCSDVSGDVEAGGDVNKG